MSMVINTQALRLALFTICLSGSSFAQYTVNDLGVNVGNSSATAINNLGQVTGTAGQVGGSNPGVAYRTAPNSPINLATDNLGGFGAATIPLAINNLGQVSGSAEPASLAPSQAFVTGPNAAIQAGDVIANYNRAGGVNDHGQVIVSRTQGGQSFSAVVSPGGTTYGLGGLAPLAAQSTSANGLNNLGQAVGATTTGFTSHIHAFRTAPGQPIASSDDLGTLGGTNSTAYAVNDAGQVVGASELPSGILQHAFLTGPNQPITAGSDLGALGGPQNWSEAHAVNSSGQVVGFSRDTSGDERAFLYSNGSLIDMNTFVLPGSGIVLTEGVGINDGGQIAANGTLNGVTHAFRLDPAVPAAVLVSQLLTQFQLGTLPNVGNSFIAQLLQVQRDIANNNYGVACQDLKAFSNHVKAQSGKKLSVEQANAILFSVSQIAASLQCEG
jgi:probable HAF family extracellular repeat protein